MQVETFVYSVNGIVESAEIDKNYEKVLGFGNLVIF